MNCKIVWYGTPVNILRLNEGWVSTNNVKLIGHIEAEICYTEILQLFAWKQHQIEIFDKMGNDTHLYHAF